MNGLTAEEGRAQENKTTYITHDDLMIARLYSILNENDNERAFLDLDIQ